MCEGSICHSPTTYNSSTGRCEKECPIDKPWSDSIRDCVAPPEPETCENIAFNPINFFNGHKLQSEAVFKAGGDFPLTFSWHYNSFGNHQKSGAGYSVASNYSGETMLHTEPPIQGGGIRIRLPLDVDSGPKYSGSAVEHWRHNHSYFLAHYTLPDGATERLIAFRPNGSDLHFVNESGTFVARANRSWRVIRDLDGSQQHTGWTLTANGRIEEYDTAGRVLRIENVQGKGITYTYNDTGTQQRSIADDNGNSITLAYTDDKLIQITHNDSSVYQFDYNGGGLLQSITFPGTTNPQRVFLYEDARFPGALTGIIDEAGNTYSTFAYDDLGRAISSQHAGGANSGTVEYVNSYTRRLTNALGKSTTYIFSDVNGSKRITAVNGEASLNCASASKTYSYDGNGFIASETDWEGNTTTYLRDNLGRELTRTKAADTPSARMLTTEWHPTLNVPTKVTTPERVTDYSYDSSGRLIERKVAPVVSP